MTLVHIGGAHFLVRQGSHDRGMRCRRCRLRDWSADPADSISPLESMMITVRKVGFAARKARVQSKEGTRRGREFGGWVRCIYLKSAELTACAALASACLSPWAYTCISPIAPLIIQVHPNSEINKNGEDGSVVSGNL